MWFALYSQTRLRPYHFELNWIERIFTVSEYRALVLKTVKNKRLYPPSVALIWRKTAHAMKNPHTDPGAQCHTPLGCKCNWQIHPKLMWPSSATIPSDGPWFETPQMAPKKRKKHRSAEKQRQAPQIRRARNQAPKPRQPHSGIHQYHPRDVTYWLQE